MAAEWVPFHRSLTRGTKRGLPRGARFVYLEIALEARHGDGRIRMPVGFPSDLDALHDMLGGDKRELAAALKTLGAPLPGEDEPMLRFEGEPACRSLVVVAFHDWAKASETSTPRVRKHREAKAAAAALGNVPPETPRNVSPTVPVTPTQEEKREEETPLPPDGAKPVEGPRHLPKSEVSEWGPHWMNRYASGIQAGLGREWAFDASHLRYLEQAINAFCKDKRRIDDWVEKSAREFAKATRTDESRLWSEHQAKGHLRWWNGGRPGYRAPASEKPRQAAPSIVDEKPTMSPADSAAAISTLLAGLGRGGASA